MLENNFIKTKENNKLNYSAGVVSIVVNTLLFILKYWIGIISGSVALLADAWHTLSDSLSSIIVIIGLKFSSQKADKKHPFGHGRLESIISILVGVMLAIVAYEFITESINKFKNPDNKAIFGSIAIVITIISIIIKEVMAQYSFWVARKTGNSSIKADGWHHRSDAFSSIIVLIGIFLQKYFWWIDAIMGICVSLILLYVVFTIIKEAVNKIIGESLSDETIIEIKNIINEKYGNDLNAHHFHIHNYGNHKELTFHIKLPPETLVIEAHKIASEIEIKLKTKCNFETTVHIEPYKN